MRVREYEQSFLLLGQLNLPPEDKHETDVSNIKWNSCQLTKCKLTNNQTNIGLQTPDAFLHLHGRIKCSV